MNKDTLRADSPFAATDFAERVDGLFYFMLSLSGLIVLLVTTLMVVFCVRYRRGKVRKQYQRGADRRLEYLWIALPALVFMACFAWGANIFMDLQRPPQQSTTIQAVAKQWMWKFYHTGGQQEINSLHVPVGRPVVVELVSEDVVHSFYVPRFRVKQDAVPGRTTRVWFQVEEAGEYRLFCAEYCGTEHSRMRGTVTALPPEAFSRWLRAQDADNSLAAAGERLFRSLGCSGCHSPNAAVPAPALSNLYQRQVPLNNGTTVIADRAYLRDAILLPEKHIVAGYSPLMPSYSEQLSEADLLKLLSYLQSLSTTPAEEPPR